jgi:chaperonin GroES
MLAPVRVPEWITNAAFKRTWAVPHQIESVGLRDINILTLEDLTMSVQTEKKVKIKPLHDRVLIELLEAEEKTKGGIVLPDTAKEEKAEGKIIGLGSGKRLKNGTLQPFEVKKGDRVLFGKYAGDELEIDGKKHKVLKEDEILAIVQSSK